MEKRIINRADLLESIWQDDVSMSFDSLASFEQFTSLDADCDIHLHSYKMSKGINSNPDLSTTFFCRYIEEHGYRVFIVVQTVNADNHISTVVGNNNFEKPFYFVTVRKFFQVKDYHVSFRKRASDLPYIIDYNSSSWVSKRYHRCSRGDKNKPSLIERDGSLYGCYTLSFEMSEKFGVGKVILSAHNKYIYDVHFYKNYGKVFDLSSLQSISPDIAADFRFRVRSLDKFTVNNKKFRENMKVIEMMAI